MKIDKRRLNYDLMNIYILRQLMMPHKGPYRIILQQL